MWNSPPRDLANLVVPRVGSLVETGTSVEPYRLEDAEGASMTCVATYFRELLATGRSTCTLRSYGLDLLRWFRYLWAIGVAWNRATRVEGRDFSCWFGSIDKPTPVAAGDGRAATAAAVPAKYSAATRAHSETVLRSFYEFHLEMGSGPLVNPFPLARSKNRRHAHHNPMEPIGNERAGLFRPRHVERIPRCIPDRQFDELFAGLDCHRDRALVAFWVSSGVRASELLALRHGQVDPGQQLITVTRKGNRAIQPVPASPDAFVWLRLYQVEMHGRVPATAAAPVWWTMRKPYRPLQYHAAYRMFHRLNERLGTQWRLHDLRHTAAYRMTRDPAMPLTDVQWVLGHARLSTTQRYTTPLQDDVIASVLAYFARPQSAPAPSSEALPYRPATLTTLFGDGVWS